MADPLASRRAFLRNLILSTAGLAGYGTLPASTPATGGAPRVRLGIDVLEESGFRILKGARIGLLTHPAGVNRRGLSSIEVLRRAPQVRLVALFGPEHGIYGNEKANVPVDDRIDPRTGLPVFSLYGKYRRPTPAMLDRIDTMVVDLQDIGSRSYTYVSCMRYVIEECFKAGKRVVVLDRPNPLGGLKTDGPPLEEKWMSYVGAFQVPYVHGLTIGELANMAKNRPGVLKVPDAVRRGGRLEIVRMKGWRRSMMWTRTGLRWVPTSPAIPDLSAAMGYPMTGLGTQLGGFAHGYGTRYPFRLIQYPETPPEVISRTLAARRIRGLGFPVISFSVRDRPRRATYVRVSSWQDLRPVELSLHLMAQACLWSRSGNPFAGAAEARQSLFNKHVGDGSVLESLIRSGGRIDIPLFLSRWESYNARFRSESRPYRLYS